MMTHDVDEARVRTAMPLVAHCVTGVMARVPRHVRRDELVSAGLLGLAQAAKTWDATRGVPFEHYARTRINGAMLDELRSRDWATRSARRDTRRLHVVTEELTGRMGRRPHDVEVAAELGMSCDDVDRINGDVQRSVVLHLDVCGSAQGEGSDGLADDPSADPIQQLLNREMHGYLHDAVLALPPRLRKIMVEYFFEDRPMQDIADDLGVTISRVSQLRGEAIKLLREGIEAQFDERSESPAPASRAERKRAEFSAAIARASDFAMRLTASAPPLVERAAKAG